jgi:excisionase family DNA binding protein
VSIAFIKSIIALVQAQWRPYNYDPDPRVYEELKCPYAQAKSRKKPFWFVRGDAYLCVACSRGCALSRPKGFVAALPVQYKEKAKKDDGYMLSPAEMVARKALLRVDETAYCLNVSERLIYVWIEEGKLRKVRGQPVRIPAEDVAARMRDIQE